MYVKDEVILNTVLITIHVLVKFQLKSIRFYMKGGESIVKYNVESEKW